MAPKPKAVLKTRSALKLPALITSPADIGRLLQESQQIDEALLQAGLRHTAGAPKKLKTSRMMDQIIELNVLNVLHQADRQELKQFLSSTKALAPVLHISFSVDPTPAFLEKLLSWLRQEIHPLILVNVGLQPSLGVGCVVRTTNKYFDFSLRKKFAKKSDLLVKELMPAGAKA